MIEKISSIKNVRNFIDFNSEVELVKKNVIYAPNGSGKTNLTRLFKRITNKEAIESMKSSEATDEIEFEIICDEETVNNTNYIESSLSDNWHIFNSDFIDNTIRINDFKQNDLTGNVEVSIGEESNNVEELKGQLEAKQVEIDNLCDSLHSQFDEYELTKRNSSGIASNEQNVWKELKFEFLINEQKEVIEEEQIITENAENDLQEIKEVDESSAPSLIEDLTRPIQATMAQLTELYPKITEPKTFEIQDTGTKEILKGITTQWLNDYAQVKLGLEKSNDEGKCFFCQRDLDENVIDLFAKFELAIGDEESTFKENLRADVSKIETLIGRIDELIIPEVEQIEQLVELLKIDNSWIEINTQISTDMLHSLIQKIKEKIDAPEIPQVINEFTTLQSELQNLNRSIASNNSLITRIQNKVRHTSTRKTELRTQIGANWRINFREANTTDLTALTEHHMQLAQLKADLNQAVQQLPSQKVIDHFIDIGNHFLNSFLGIQKYKFSKSNNQLIIRLLDFDISQHTNDKISEGERTILSLVYFLVSTIKCRNNLEDFKKTVFILDDPITSTSYNYLFGLANLLKNFDQVIAKKVWSESENTYLNSTKTQKLIFSHNTQFFNCLKTQVFKNNAQYHLLNSKSLKKIGRKQLMSDFQFALYQIKKTITNINDDTNICNDIRRVFESIRHFYGYKEDFTSETLKKVFYDFDENTHQVFFSVINYYSHGNPEADTDPLVMNLEPFLEQFDNLISNSQFKERWESIEV